MQFNTEMLRNGLRKGVMGLCLFLTLTLAGTFAPDRVGAETTGANQEESQSVESGGNDGTEEAANPGAVKNLAVDCETDQITLTWDAAANAGSYIVTRQASDESNPVTMKNLETGKAYFTGTEYTDEDIDPTLSYTYTVTARANADGTGLAGETAKISGVKVSVTAPVLSCLSAGQSAVMLSWTPAGLGDNCQWGYRIYRKVVGGSWSVLTNLSNTVTSYTDTSSKKIGTSYIYLLRAYVTGSSARWDSAVTVKVIPSAPKLTSATTAQGSVTLKWGSVKNAKTYYVYRKSTGTGWVKLTSTTKLTYKDTTVQPGKIYYYTVKASVKVGKTLVNSAFHPTGLKAVAPVGTAELSTLTGSSTFTLTWKAMANVSGYRIYRKSGSSGWKAIGQTTSASATSWSDSDLEEGRLYTYTVKAYVIDNGTVTWGGFNATGLSRRRQITAPKIQGAVTSMGYAAVHWATTETADGYQIYRKTGTGSYVAMSMNDSTLQNVNMYWDRSTVVGTSYMYGVRAYRLIDGVKIYSVLSAMTSAVTIYPAEPEIHSVTTNLDGTKDTITWYTVSGASGYRIYYRNAATSNRWTTAANVTAGSGTKQSYSLSRYQDGDTEYTIRTYVITGGKAYYSPFSSSDADYVSNAAKQYQNTSIMFLGDSITYGYVYYGASGYNKAQTIPYYERVEQITGADVSSSTTSTGKTMAERTGVANSCAVQIANGSISFSDKDVICIALGTNDYGYNVPLGKGTGDTSVSTFYGAWNYTLQTIQEQNPEAKVVLITPFYRGKWATDYSYIGMDTANTVGHTLQDYTDAIYDMADKYRDQGMDIYVYDSVECAQSYGSNAVTITASNYWWKTGDALHPTQNTYMRIGNSIAAFLKDKVLAPDEEEESESETEESSEPETEESSEAGAEESSESGLERSGESDTGENSESEADQNNGSGAEENSVSGAEQSSESSAEPSGESAAE